MKKNLNIAYLNGAEGMIRRGGASSGGGESGGSGSGSSSGDNNFKYYKFNPPLAPFKFSDTIYNYDEAQYLITHMRSQLNGGRYMYGTFAGLVRYFGNQSQSPYVDAFAFSPTALYLGSEKGWITIKSYEELAALYSIAFPPISYVTEITAEEYWEHFNAE